MLQISEVAKLSGVSVRTLHYYDEIDLLKPTRISESGYRYYDEKAIEKLQQILFYRELDFSLKEISDIISDPKYDKSYALRGQKALLLIKKKRLEGLIALIDQNLKGDCNMSFKEFDIAEIISAKEKYSAEVKERWGNTDEYKESEIRTSGYDKKKWADLGAQSDSIFKDFAANMNEFPGSQKVQNLVADWQKFITENYYNCSNEVLYGLGIMYVNDERFKSNIDKYSEGLAEFISEAIKIYCNRI